MQNEQAMTKFGETDLLRFLVDSSKVRELVIEGVREQDDCAVLSVPEGYEVCATTDFVRGTGFTLFKRGHLSLEDVGRYVVVANLSDLAAMGASPLGYLSVVRYLPEREQSEVEAIMAGIQAACDDHSCSLIGGDSGTYDCDVLSGTAIGYLPKGKRLSRHTAKSGDVLMVTGEIGGAGAAMAAELGGLAQELPEEFANCLRRWQQPQPRLAFGQRLLRIAERISAMDVSDGLTASLLQLRRITGLGFSIEGNALPISSAVRTIAARLGKDPIDLACSASVDFELLICCPESAVEQVKQASTDCSLAISIIGRVSDSGNIVFSNSLGETLSNVPGVPWDHQVSDVSEIYR